MITHRLAAKLPLHRWMPLEVCILTCHGQVCGDAEMPPVCGESETPPVFGDAETPPILTDFPHSSEGDKMYDVSKVWTKLNDVVLGHLCAN